MSDARAAIPPLPNPFDGVDDDRLYEMQVALTYGCLRSKAALHLPNKRVICELLSLLEGQARQRPSKMPRFPFPPEA